MNNETIIIIDRSGSMGGREKVTVDGINEFIETNRCKNPEGLMSIYQFDHEHETLFEKQKCKYVKAIEMEDYKPRGNTALYDAIGRVINSRKNDRNTTVIIVTDGYENASQEFNANSLKSMISDKENNKNWEFVYLGANQDAILEASKFGIKSCSTTSYDLNNTRSMYNLVANKAATRGVTGQSISFSNEDRDNLVNPSNTHSCWSSDENSNWVK